MAYQRAYFPTNHIYLGQGYGALSKTHKHSYALDLSGNFKPFAPFDCKVSKLYVPKKKDGTLDTTHAFEVWLTSTKKVLCANGVYDYLTLSITHPKGISKLNLGQTFKQFDNLGFSTEEMTGNYSGNHIHVELSLGKKAGWDKDIQNKYNDYVNINKIKLEEYLFITNNAVVLSNKYKLKTYNFIREKDITYKVVGVPSEPLFIRDKDNKVVGKLYNGNDVLKFNNNIRCLVYHYECLGYTPRKYLRK